MNELEKDIIGVDLGGTSAKFALVSQSGEIKNKWSIPTDISENGKNIVPSLIDSISQFLKENNLAKENIFGIGMGSPGNVNRKNKTVIGAYNLGWATLQNVGRQIEQSTGIRFYLDNDANVAALGEQWKGAGNKEDNVIFITLGTGVGGGIIVDGRLVHGATDSAGEIGHLTVSSGKYEYECTCGKRGCLETVASATGVARIARDKLEEYSGSSSLAELYKKQGTIEAKDVFDEAKKGDELAESVVDEVTDFLSLACGNLANILNPSTIVLGGGVSKAGEFLLEKVRSGFERYVYPQLKDVTKIRIAELENDAGVIGASSLVKEEIKNGL